MKKCWVILTFCLIMTVNVLAQNSLPGLSFSPQNEGLDSPELMRIIGDNNLVIIKSDRSNIPKKYRSLLGAFGKIEKGCTITHIGNGYAITAGHCFWQTFFNANLIENAPCSEVKIDWGLLDNQNSESNSVCENIISMQKDVSRNIDYALIKVSNPPKVKIKLDFTERNYENRSITLFSYPGANSLSWSTYCKVLNPQAAPEFPGYLVHKCDTDVGSSGAVIIDIKTMKAIGQHVSGDTTETDPTIAVPMFNLGYYLYQSPLKSILERLAKDQNTSDPSPQSLK